MYQQGSSQDCDNSEGDVPGCPGVPEYADDLYCDDENNNAECNYDGGACCQENPQEGWDNWCTICECKEGSECKDTWSAKKCKKQKKKCNKKNVKKNCMKTCGNCDCDGGDVGDDCQDHWAAKKCKKQKKKCSKKKVKQNCRKTCGDCGHGGNGGDTCQDIWSTKKCKKSQKKCNMENVKTNCMMTCGLCIIA